MCNDDILVFSSSVISMKHISQQEEQPFTSSLKICPKACCSASPLTATLFPSSSVDISFKRRHNRLSPMCFLYGNLISFRIGCLVLPLSCLAIVTPVLLHNGYLIKDKSNNLYIKNLTCFCHFPINIGFLMQAMLRSIKFVLWCIRYKIRRYVAAPSHLTNCFMLASPCNYLLRSFLPAQKFLFGRCHLKRIILACSKENRTHRKRSENQITASWNSSLIPSKRW